MQNTWESNSSIALTRSRPIKAPLDSCLCNLASSAILYGRSLYDLGLDLNKITKEIGKVIAAGYNIDLLEKNSSEVKQIIKTKKDWSKNTFFKINNNMFTSFTPNEKKNRLLIHLNFIEIKQSNSHQL